jgi:hypothetical protein
MAEYGRGGSEGHLPLAVGAPPPSDLARRTAAPTSGNSYPVRVTGELDLPLSRWLWLVKWLLAIPHIIVLLFPLDRVRPPQPDRLLAILFTERYPRRIFDFNLGVLRWTWRVAFYSYGALGTDRYPPSCLRRYPTTRPGSRVDYPERLSRGLELVKWWLLAMPHYIVVGLFEGGWGPRFWGPGMIGALASSPASSFSSDSATHATCSTLSWG